MMDNRLLFQLRNGAGNRFRISEGEDHHRKDMFGNLKIFSGFIDLMLNRTDVDRTETKALAKNHDILCGGHQIGIGDEKVVERLLASKIGAAPLSPLLDPVEIETEDHR